MTFLEVPLDDGHASLKFATAPISQIFWVYAFLGLVATALAGILGSRLGQRFAADVAIATRAVRETGAADVLRGSRVRREARFDSVILLMDAIDSLGGVFREFASAQERAIDARAATERMRGLFLASMSHDLKGPLNAILGFADLCLPQPVEPRAAREPDHRRAAGSRAPDVDPHRPRLGARGGRRAPRHPRVDNGRRRRDVRGSRRAGPRRWLARGDRRGDPARGPAPLRGRRQARAGAHGRHPERRPVHAAGHGARARDAPCGRDRDARGRGELRADGAGDGSARSSSTRSRTPIARAVTEASGSACRSRDPSSVCTAGPWTAR